MVWLNLFLLHAQAAFPVVKKEKEILLKIITLTTKFSCKAFHQSERWLKKVSCWNAKFLRLIFFNELRASFRQFERFIQTSLRHSFFVIRNDKGLFSFTKCIALEYKLRLSTFGRMLLHEFVCTFHSYWFRPTVATIDIISDSCCWRTYNFFQLNLTYRILLHWIGGIKRRQLYGREVQFERFRNIDRGTTCFPDIPCFCSKLNETFWSNLRWFDSLKRRAN